MENAKQFYDVNAIDKRNRLNKSIFILIFPFCTIDMKEAEERSNRPKRSISPIHRDGIQEVWESTPDQSLADVTYKDNSDPLPTRGLANTMKEKFFQVKNSHQFITAHA